MFAAIMLAASLAPPAAPAPLPDRWLLKLVPEKLPPLPDRFYDVTWYHHGSAPNVGINWEVWADFRKAGKGRSAEADLTMPKERERLDGFGWGSLGMRQAPTTPGHRTVPLAVHGPLVEFERRLYTATIRTRKAISGKQTEEMLHLGSAIELEKGVWYQAGTSMPSNGRGVIVEEWRIDFRDDPRTKDWGKAKLRGYWRVLIEPEGKSFDADVSFQAGKTYLGGRTVTLNWPTGMQQTRRLPYLEIEDTVGGPNIMRLDDMHMLSLEPATKQRPKLPPEQFGLVQPPMKAAGK